MTGEFIKNWVKAGEGLMSEKMIYGTYRIIEEKSKFELEIVYPDKNFNKLQIYKDLESAKDGADQFHIIFAIVFNSGVEFGRKKSEGFELISEIGEKCFDFRSKNNLEKEDVVIELSNHTGHLIGKIPNSEIQGLSREFLNTGIEEYFKKEGLHGMKTVINNQLDVEKKSYNIRKKAENEKPSAPIS